jgi:uncharacterized protein (TIGR02147 family)
MNTDAASFLKEIFSQKAIQNPQFSMRAFARTLGISPGGLSQILNRKIKLSIDRAHEIASKLQVSSKQVERFLTLVEIESATNVGRKLELIQKLDRKKGATDLAVDNFNLIASWYGFAILVFVTECASPLSVSLIARRLGITKAAVEVTLERLSRLELIEIIKSDARELKVKRLHDTVLVQTEFASEALKKYYLELQSKTTESLSDQTPDTRVSGSQVFAFDRTQVPEIKRLSDKYLDDLENLAAKGKKRSEIYQAVTHVFQLTKDIKGKLK